MTDKVTRYTIEIDASQAIGTYKNLEILTDAYNNAARKAALSIIIGSKNAASAVAEEEAAWKALNAEIQKAFQLSGVGMKIRGNLAKLQAQQAKEAEQAAKQQAATEKKAIEDVNKARMEDQKRAAKERAEANKARQAIHKQVETEFRNEMKFIVERQKLLAASIRDETKLNDERVKRRRAQLAEERKAEQAKAKERDAQAKAEVRAEQLAEKGRERALKELLRQIKAYPQLREELARLVATTGTLNVKFNEQGEALTEDAKALQAVIDKSENLRREQQHIIQQAGGAQGRVTQADARSPSQQFAFTAFQLRQLGFGFERLGVQGLNALTSIGTALAGIPLSTAAGVVGVLGLVLAVTKLTQAFIELGKMGAKAFAQLVKESIEVASTFQTVEASLTGLFQQDPVSASKFIQRIREESIRLGTDVEELVRKVIPLVSSIEDAFTVAELAIGLAQLDPKAGPEGAVQAIQAATVGRLEPLRRRYDIDPAPIQRAQKEFGLIQGLMIGLGEILEQRGLDFETISDTFAVQTGRMRQRWEDLQLVLGEPIVDEIVKGLISLQEFIEKEGIADNLEVIFRSIGLVIADLVKFANSAGRILGDVLDEDTAERVAEAFLEIGETIRTVIAAFSDKGGIELGASVVVQLLEHIAAVANHVAEGLFNAVAAMEAFGTVIVEHGIDPLALIKDPVGAAINALTGLDDVTNTFAESLAKSRERLMGVKGATNETRNELDDFKKAQDEAADSADDLINAYIALNNATTVLADAQNVLAEETEKVNQAIRDATKESFRDRVDAIIKLGRDMADAERKASEQRVDAIRDFQQKMQDLMKKHRQRIADAELDANRKGQDLALQHTDKLEDLELKHTDKLLDLEEEYQKKLAEIRRKFDFEAEEAIRNNDAVALLRIRRRMMFELNEARINRDEKAQEEQDDRDRRAEDEERDNERRLRDQQIAHQRRLEDLNKQLNRELQDEQEALKRRFEEFQIDNQRRRDEIVQSYNRQNEDIKRALERRLADLKAELADETRAVIEATRVQTEALLNMHRQVAASRRMIMGAAGGAAAGMPGGGGVPLTPTGQGGPRPGRRSAARALGGPIFTGQPVIVGDPDPARPNKPNPELIIPAVNGMVVPLSRMMFNPPTSPAMSSIFNNQRTVHADISLADVDRLSPVAERRVRNIVVEMMREALGG